MRKVLITLIGFTIVSLASLGGYKAYEDAQDAKIMPSLLFKELDTFEYGDKVEIEKEYPVDKKVKQEKDTIYLQYKDIIDEEGSDYHTLKTIGSIKTDKVGEFKVKIIATRREQEETFEFIYNVEDTQKPKLSKVKDQTITEGDSFSFDDLNFSAKDPIDGKLKVKYKGEFDTHKPGQYKLVAYAKDKNNNKTEKNFKLIVEEKEEIIIEPEEVVQNTPKPSTPKQESKPDKQVSNPSGTYRDDLAKDMFNKVVSHRKKHGEGWPLVWSSEVVSLAKTRSKELLTHPGHDRPDGSRITIWGHAIENYYIGSSVDEAMNFLINSEEHNKAMIGQYLHDHLAVSIYEENGILYIIQIFTRGPFYLG